jgi:colanic acid/amylovoran biosynthesis glycosyltransferase
VLALKIAYFINHYPKVSHSFIRREILSLERQGFHVQRIALRGWDDPLPDEEDRQERQQTIYVLRKGPWDLLVPTFRALLRSPARFFGAIALAARMARHSDRPLPYHIACLAEACWMIPRLATFNALRLHAHFGTNSAEVAMLAHALGGPPFSFTVHGPEEFQRPMHLGEKIHRSNFAVAISSFGRSQLYLNSSHSDWPKIKVVHCGLESTFYEGPRAPFTSAQRFVCVGRLCEAKGQLLLVEATSLLSARGTAVEVVLAGDGPLRSEIEKLIERFGLAKQIRITGWISSREVRDEILAARALVLPSFAEGLPVVIMEAMALRRPVLTTYVAGIPELVRPCENGWLFPAGSVHALADVMEICLSASDQTMQEFGDAGYRRVVERHSIDTEAGKLAELLRAPPSTHG